MSGTLDCGCQSKLRTTLYLTLSAVTKEKEASLDTGTIKNKNSICMGGCEQEVHLPALSVYPSICVSSRVLHPWRKRGGGGLTRMFQQPSQM